MTETLTLTRADCEAVMSYVWQHSRASPNGRAFKVWQKMWAFVCEEKTEEEPADMPLFEKVMAEVADSEPQSR